MRSAVVTDVMVVVIGYNSARHLDPLAKAVKSGSLTPERLVMVDNASEDDTVAAAHQAGFEVHEMESNAGFGAACNAALRTTRTDFILFCNPDVRPSVTALEELVAALTASPSSAVAGVASGRPSRARRFSRLTRNVWSLLPGCVEQRLKRFEAEFDVEPGDGNLVVDYVVGSFMLCRTSAIRSVGGFDERFFLYSEEEDLCRRLATHGWRTVLVPSVAVAHEPSTSSAGGDRTVMAPFRFHSLYWYYRKHHSRPYAEIARAVLAICLIFDGLYRRTRRRQQVYGLGAAAAPFRNIDKLRRDYQLATGRHRTEHS
jgi:N-acetylglucosaminyl-diphospho-decaprenol L-rhamnosyltransferase